MLPDDNTEREAHEAMAAENRDVEAAYVDPFSGTAGFHPAGAAVGALAGGTSGAALGTTAGPVGIVVGTVIGAIVGGLGGKGVDEALNTTDPAAAERVTNADDAGKQTTSSA